MRRLTLILPLILAAAWVSGLGAGEDSEFDYGGIREIVVSAATFEVDVQGARGRTTSVEVRNESDNYRVLHSRSGDRLEIWVERKVSLFGRPHRGRISILAPGDIELQVETSTGAVTIRDIVADRLRVDTTTGPVDLAEIDADVRVETSTGGVQILDSSGNDFHQQGYVSIVRRGYGVNILKSGFKKFRCSKL
jgi:hypothetical protein